MPVDRKRGSSLRFSGNLYSCKMSINIVNVVVNNVNIVVAILV